MGSAVYLHLVNLHLVDVNDVGAAKEQKIF